jgi:multiple sugar transport system substrate-binding protein
MFRELISGCRAGCWLLLACLAAGCSETDAPPADALPFAGQQVTIAVPASLGSATAWELSLAEWSQQTGAEPRLVEYATPDGKFDVQAAKAATKDAPQSVIVFPASQLATMAALDLLEPIPEDLLSAEGLAWFDFFRGLGEKVAASSGKPIAVPMSCPVLVCYYRGDLLEQASLEPPSTWADYQHLASTVGSWAPGLTVAEPWSPEFRATLFLARAVSYAQHPDNLSLFIDIDDGTPLINGPGFIRALEDCAAAWKSMPADVKSLEPADCRRAVLNGTAAIGIAYEVAGGAVSEVSTAAPAGNRPDGSTVGFCRLPGSHEVYDRSAQAWQTLEQALHGGTANDVTLTAFDGWLMGVTQASGAHDSRAAWNLVSVLLAPGSNAAFPPGAKALCRESELSEPTTWAGADLTSAEAQEYVDAVDESFQRSQLVAELPLLGRDELKGALTEGVTQALDGATAPEAALHATAAKWREIIERIGLENAVNSYRRSLGLRERPRSEP